MFNSRTRVMMELVNVVVDDVPERKESILEDEDDQLVQNNDGT